MSKKNVFKEGVDSYSINLLWINRKKDESLEYIHPAKNAEGMINDKKSLIDKLLNPALNWAKENKKEDNAEIKIWYDASLHTPEQIENTKQVLSKLVEKQKSSNITLNDINKIDFVKNNKFLFTEDSPLYFRIDFFKLIILVHELDTERKDGAVFSDTEVCDLREDERGEITGKRFDKAELYDTDSMEKLEKFGIITNATWSGDSRVAENQFIQSLNDSTAIKALKHTINACSMRAVAVFNASTNSQKYIMPTMYHIVLHATLYEVARFHRGLKAGIIKINDGFAKQKIPNDQWKNWNFEEDGYECFGNVMLRENFGYSIFDLHEDSPERVCEVNQASNFGFKENECISVRKCFTRNGGEHNDKFIIPEEGHKPFEPWYWPINDEVGTLG